MQRRAFVLLGLAVLVTVPAALAQIPTPSTAPSTSQAPASPQTASPTALPNLTGGSSPSDAAAAAAKAAEDNFFLVDPRDAAFANDPRMIQAERDRQVIRDAEFQRTGMKWMSLPDAGLKVREMILKSDPKLKDDLRQNGRNMDVAITDFDHDDLPDLVFHNWADGRADGYNYFVVFGNTNKPNRQFFGMTVKPFRDGILVDKAYYVL